ncbi:polysaccharide biosynthesis protein [Heyndrickxia coagulans]|uniref:oligosaccharide flippase family protein n=1 Tax=Heyndrickxia coagulans TaxID=1398 RepID=UPI000E49DA5C|nr:oligosaccharide flippase family protein [Heyndrickxia coagulans]RGR83290.1 polysaccharide biosynthesis protein [Heyndrickxia coagulans]
MKNSFIKKLVGFSLGPVFGALISFITIPLTTHFISPEEYGKASMFSLMQVLIVSFLYLGFDQAYTREYNESNEKENLLKNSLLFPLIISLAILMIIVFNLNWTSKLLFDSKHFHLAAFLFGVTIVVMTIERFILLSIRMKEKAIEFSILNILVKACILVVTIIFLKFIRKDFLAVVYSSVIGQIIGDVYLLIRYRMYLNYLNFKFDRKLVYKMLKFGFPLVLASSLNTLLNSLDRIFLRVFSTFTEVGIFTAAQKVSAVLSVIQASFTSFWTPTAYRWYSEKKEIKHFEFISSTILLIMSTLFIVILICKNFVIKILSNGYSETTFIIGMLCLQPIMYTISETTTLGIVFSRKSYLNLYVSIISIIPNVILNFLLVPKLGATGAAIATGVSYIFFFLSRSYFSNRLWIGFPLKTHFFVTVILFISALVNTFSLKYITLINLFSLIFVISIQYNTLVKFYKIYFKRTNEDWDFS